MDHVTNDGVAAVSAFVLSAFGALALALALAAVSLYGVVSSGVAQRTHEIGIPMALGTHGPTVVRQLVASDFKLAVVGGARGLALAVVATRRLGGLLFEMDALNPLTFLGMPLVRSCSTSRHCSQLTCRPAAPAKSIRSPRSGLTERRHHSGRRARAPAYPTSPPGDDSSALRVESTKPLAAIRSVGLDVSGKG